MLFFRVLFALAIVVTIISTTFAQVLVTFQILSGTPTPSELANQLNLLYQSGRLNDTLGFPVVNLSISSFTSSPSTVPTTRPQNPSPFLTYFVLPSGATQIALFSHSLFAILLLSVALLPWLKKYVSKFLFLVFLVYSHHVEALSRNYQNCRLLDSTIQYKLYWTLNSDSIDIALEAKSGGWIAFGLSGNGYMDSGGQSPGSDITMGYIDPSSSDCYNGCVNDYYTLRHDIPILDTVQNIITHNVSEVNGVLTVEYSRLLDTGDNTHDRVITPMSPMYIIWAANVNTKPTSPSVFTIHTHYPAAPYNVPIIINWNQTSQCIDSTGLVQGTIVLDISIQQWNETAFKENLARALGIPIFRINVVSVKDITPPFCPNCLIVELTAANYTVPPQKTTYVCRGFSLPTNITRHIVRLEPIRDSSLVLHHMVIFTIARPFSLNTYTPCTMVPIDAQPFFAWAPGSVTMDMPSNVGFQIDSSTPYAVIQYHYDNPQQISGQVDDSGFRLYMTDSLRPLLAGLLFLGIPTNFISIPPNVSAWYQSGACGKSATNTLSAVPGGSITVFSYFLHEHYIGRSIWTELYRNNTLVEYIGAQCNWNFNDQKFEPINTTIRPGDELVTHCVWDSTNRTTTTLGGESTNNEMCLNLFLYYPMIPGALGCYTNVTAGQISTVSCPSNP